MLLNKLPVLDKGYVALIQSTFNSQIIESIRDELFGAQEANDRTLLRKMGRLTMVVKCPIFIARSLGQYSLDIVHAPSATMEAYIPNVGDIQSGDHATDVAIADDIGRTTEALLLNPKAYIADGCNRFIAQLITPINVYVTMIVSGPYNEWDKFIKATGLPEPIKAYQDAVTAIVKNEWNKHGEETNKEEST